MSAVRRKSVQSPCRGRVRGAFEGVKESYLAGAKGVSEKDGTRAGGGARPSEDLGFVLIGIGNLLCCERGDGGSNLHFEK